MVLGCALLSSCAAPPVRWDFVECPSPTGSSLRGLAAFGEREAIVSGEGGIVLSTRDGGETWAPVGPREASGLDLRSLAAVDQRRFAVASAGAPARIYATADGGRTWVRAFEDTRPSAFLDSLAFDGNGRGVALGDPIEGRFSVLVTRDGGITWHDLQEAAPRAVEGEAAFAASSGCVALPAGRVLCFVTGGARSRALLSRDDGATWAPAGLPIEHGSPSKGAFAVAFADERRGVALGGDYADLSRPGSAAFTRDGGRTWRAAAIPPSGFRSSVAALPEEGVFVAVGPAGSSLSRDGGRTWTRLSALGFHVVRAAPDGAVWAAGSGGRIARLRRR
ncbi:MAG: oxidoreductase [Planctomycetota bacterium]